MQKLKKILLIDSTGDSLASMEGALRVAGYNLLVECCPGDAGLDYLVSVATPNRIDLLIIEAASLQFAAIQKIVAKRIVDAVLYVDIQPAATKPYCINGHQGWLYQRWALLAAVKELMLSVENENHPEAANPLTVH